MNPAHVKRPSSRPVRRASAVAMPAMLAVVVILTCGAGTARAQTAIAPTTTTPAANTSMPETTNTMPAYRPLPHVLSGGQPGEGDWDAIAALGVRRVIDLRPAGELANRDEAAEVEAAGMRYTRIPVEGAAGLTADKATALWAQLQAAQGETLVHCATGNRVGGLLALAAFNDGGMPAEAALELGRKAGMTSTESRVRELLQLPPLPLAVPAPAQPTK